MLVAFARSCLKVFGQQIRFQQILNRYIIGNISNGENVYEVNTL